MSITGRVYVQTAWPPLGSAGGDDSARERSRRLLGSVDGLADKLASTEWPETPAAEEMDATRLEQTRAAVAADYYNEGLPLAQLKAEGVWLPPADPAGAPDPAT